MEMASAGTVTAMVICRASCAMAVIKTVWHVMESTRLSVTAVLAVSVCSVTEHSTQAYVISAMEQERMNVTYVMVQV